MKILMRVVTLCVVVSLGLIAQGVCAMAGPKIETVETKGQLAPGDSAKLDIEGKGILRAMTLRVERRDAVLRGLKVALIRNDSTQPEFEVALSVIFGDSEREGIPGARKRGNEMICPLERSFGKGVAIVLTNTTGESVPYEISAAYTPRGEDDFVELAMVHRNMPGTLLTEDFEAGEIDTSLWNKWVQDEGLSLSQKDGTYSIAGITGKPVMGKGVGFRFTGLVSQQRRSQDCVLVSRMRVPKGISDVHGMERYIVHLCGSCPDWFLEVVYGKNPAGQKGWFQLVNYADGHTPDDTPVLADESADDFRDIMITYSHKDKLSQGFLKVGDEWVAVGEPKPLALTTMKVELKLNCPKDGADIQADFQECRLYPKPSTAPVEFITYRPPLPFFLCPGLKLRVLESESGRVLGEVTTDDWARGFVALPDDLTYPIGCKIEVFKDGKQVAEGEINCEGVEGLYPGDVWTIQLPEYLMEE